MGLIRGLLDHYWPIVAPWLAWAAAVAIVAAVALAAWLA